MSEEFKTSKARAERCVTHHHACDCREYKFQELEQQLEELNSPVQLSEWQKLEQQLAELREAARQHILAIEKYQYGQTPAVPLPGVAKTANELAALLESSDETK